MKNLTFITGLVWYIVVPAKCQWELLNSSSAASFRSLAVVNKRMVWVGGSEGTILKTTNGGEHWERIKVGDTTLDFRGLAALGKKKILAMSAGLAQDKQAKIFKSGDGGKNWEMVFNTDQTGVFLDGIHFLNRKHGFVIGDPIDGNAYVLETFDGGHHWVRVPADRFPKLNSKEASFAASNSGIISRRKKIWYALQSRLLISEDYGKSWRIIETGFPAGETRGIFGMIFWNITNGLLLGGDYKQDASEQTNIALTADGGLTWNLQSADPPGLKEAACKVGNSLIAVGPSGSSLSIDFGKNWQLIDTKSFHVVGTAGKWCFAAGARGRLARMKLKKGGTNR